MKTKTKILSGIAAALLLTSGVSLAYFTDSTVKNNVFTIGSIRSVLHEEKWDAYPDMNKNDIPDIAENIVPLNRINKDPKIENTGKNAFYAFIQVDMPIIDAITVNAEDGSKNERAITELFEFHYNDTWQQLSHILNDNNATYVFGYKKVLELGQTTDTLFDTVQFVNFIEAQGLEDQTETITVKSMTIQSEETGTMQEAYEKFIAQNPEHKVGE